MPSVVTIRDVELVRLGTWDASTGPITITEADLADVLAAAQDTEVDAGPIKIGHTGAWSALGDSAPALGWIANVRRAGDRLIGDLVDVPARLAQVMPKAFRRRSVELLRNVTTPGGRTYRMALAGLALLGVQPPAVKGLADLLALYDADSRPIAASDGELGDEAVTLDVIEGDPSGGHRELIAAAAATLAGSVIEGRTTPEVAGATLDAIFAAAGVPEATIHHDEPRPGHASTDDHNAPNGGLTMPLDDARIRELIGAEADADVEAALTDLRTRADAQAAAGGDGSGEGAGTGTQTPPAGTAPAGTAPAGTPAGQAPPAPAAEVAERIAAAGATIAEDGTVRLSAGTFVELLAGVEQGSQAAAVLDAQARDAALDDAVRSGRIAPAERAHFAASYATRPISELTAFLGGLAPRFSTVELGGANGATDVAEEAWDAFTADLFGAELPTGGN